MNDFERELRAIAGELGIVTSDPPKPSIMVIDDDLDIRLAIRDVLSDKYNVAAYESGDQALKDDVNVFLAVLLDVKMPKKDGLAVYGEIKEKFPLVPIIFYTAYHGIHEKHRECLRLNPRAMIQKGCDLNVLRETIELAVGAGGDSEGS